jgi:hypothetical protein
MTDVERAIEESSDDELERLQGVLALELGDDPTRLSDLEAVEAAIGRRRLDQRRDEAASQEAARRAEETAQAERDADARRKEGLLVEARRELASAASELEDLLPELGAATRKVVEAVNARSDAGLQAGQPADYGVGQSIIASRLHATLNAVLPGHFQSPMQPRYRDERLGSLLGVEGIGG